MNVLSKARRAAGFAIFMALITLGASTASAADRRGVAGGVISVKSPHLQYPDGPCTLAQRMDVAIVDGMFWECTCIRLQVGYQCDWMLISGVDEAPPPRKKIKPIKKPRSVVVFKLRTPPRAGVWSRP